MILTGETKHTDDVGTQNVGNVCRCDRNMGTGRHWYSCCNMCVMDASKSGTGCNRDISHNIYI